MISTDAAAVSARLCAIASMVSEGTAICDVGCDHAYVPIMLVASDVKKKAFACDLRPGPLSIAKENIAAAGLEEKVTCHLADGIPSLVAETLHSGEGNTLVISGMGGTLICDILSRGEKERRCFDEIILSPQSEWMTLRRQVTAMGYRIDAERLLREEEKDYLLLRFVPAPSQTLRDVEAYAGPLLLQRKDPALFACLERREQVLEEIKTALKGNEGERVRARLIEIEEERKWINEARSYL